MSKGKPLNPLAEMALITEIVTQSKFAEKAAGRINNTEDSVEVWGSIQSILVAAGNVSKILWPPRNKNKARGVHLRGLLGVANDSILSDRTVRNHFEHYDERIENWFENSISVVYMDSQITPFEPTPFSLPQFFHRSYNSSSGKLSFRGESINLKEIIEELAKIREKCKLFVLP